MPVSLWGRKENFIPPFLGILNRRKWGKINRLLHLGIIA